MSTEEVNTMEERILEAAKQVFVMKGYEATKMGDVAAEAGIGRTALHYDRCVASQPGSDHR